MLSRLDMRSQRHQCHKHRNQQCNIRASREVQYLVPKARWSGNRVGPTPQKNQCDGQQDRRRCQDGSSRCGNPAFDYLCVRNFSFLPPLNLQLLFRAGCKQSQSAIGILLRQPGLPLFPSPNKHPAKPRPGERGSR